MTDTETPRPREDMDAEEAARRIASAILVLTKPGYKISPSPRSSFTVEKPSGWRRHEVVCYVNDQREVVERFWSWDRADDLAERLNNIWRTL